jgi:hypothetical protein
MADRRPIELASRSRARVHAGRRAPQVHAPRPAARVITDEEITRACLAQSARSTVNSQAARATACELGERLARFRSGAEHNSSPRVSRWISLRLRSARKWTRFGPRVLPQKLRAAATGLTRESQSRRVKPAPAMARRLLAHTSKGEKWSQPEPARRARSRAACQARVTPEGARASPGSDFLRQEAGAHRDRPPSEGGCALDDAMRRSSPASVGNVYRRWAIWLLTLRASVASDVSGWSTTEDWRT